MREKYPLTEEDRFHELLKTIPGIEKLKNEQSTDHYEIVTETVPATQVAATIKSAQREMRHALDTSKPKQIGTDFNRDMQAAIEDLHARIKKEFGLSVDMGIEWEFRAPPVEGKPGEYMLDEIAYNGKAGTNSLHVNISVKDEANTPGMMTINKDGQGHFNRTCFNIASGLRDMLEATPLWSATDNESFHRFEKGYGAPKAYGIGAGKDGKGAVMVRGYKGGHGPDENDYDRIYAYIENRVPAGDVDPHIAVFQSLLGIYHGLNREKYLEAEIERTRTISEEDFLKTLQKYSFHGTIKEYLGNWELDNFQQVLDLHVTELQRTLEMVRNPEPQPMGRGVTGTDTPATLDKARELQQASEMVEQYVAQGVIAQVTVDTINKAMAASRTPKDGSMLGRGGRQKPDTD